MNSTQSRLEKDGPRNGSLMATLIEMTGNVSEDLEFKETLSKY